jgi:uncharacterized phage protein (TIGR02218 family)
MISIPGALEEFRTAQSHRLALCWGLERTDGTKLRFTTHNRDLVLADGYTYSPVGGFSVSAIRREADAKPHTRDAVGVISDVITEADLFAGRYRECAITEIVVDWAYPWAGDISAVTYWITDFRFDGEVWQPEIEGLTAWANRVAGDVYSRDCRWDCYDDDCGLTKASFTQSGTVASIVTAQLKFRNTISGGGGDQEYNEGELSWLTGGNAGLTSTVKAYLYANNEVELQQQTPFVVAVGDTFNVVVGCDGTRNRCKARFNNIPRFGGFPFIPGPDRVLKYK